ncbi:MAG: orotate phosphoribosyltransferase [Flavobacteriales bacterium]|nr:orotate phosphoribosyltransferase [Flavobacteriales bacterium]
MILDKDTAKKTAELLLQVKAIKLQPNDPFTWASGWKSPIYCDNRVTLSYPAIRTYIRENMVKAIEKNFARPDVIAGVATGAIAIGMLVAEEMGLPFIYIRPEAKKHGRQNQIEGYLEKGKSVLVIEDLISTGMSSLKAVDALRAVDAKVLGMVAIFTYGFDIAEKAFTDKDVELVTLSDYQHLLEQANDTNYIANNEQLLLEDWRVSPSIWKQNN